MPGFVSIKTGLETFNLLVQTSFSFVRYLSFPTVFQFVTLSSVTVSCWIDANHILLILFADLESHPSSSLRCDPPHTTSADMIIRLGRLTPGYFRLLQRQVAGEVQTQPQDRTINQIAMMLAIMGLSLSYYSAKQMTEKVQAQPAP